MGLEAFELGGRPSVDAGAERDERRPAPAPAFSGERFPHPPTVKLSRIANQRQQDGIAAAQVTMRGLWDTDQTRGGPQRVYQLVELVGENLAVDPRLARLVGCLNHRCGVGLRVTLAGHIGEIAR